MEPRPGARRYRRLVIAIALTGLTFVASSAYLPSQRRMEGANLAANAIIALADVERAVVEGASSTDPTAFFEPSMLMAEMRIPLFVDADLDVPGLRRHVERAWLAYRVSDGVLRMEHAGEHLPLLTFVPGADEALAAFPEMTRFVDGVKDSRRFVDTGDLVRDLEAKAADETAAAESEFQRLYPSFSGLDTGERGD